MTILCSGATGFLGSAVVRRCDDEVVAVLRGDHEAKAARLGRRVGRAVASRAGDVRRPSWGLSDADVDELRSHVRVVLHLAAQTSWGAATDELESTNVRGAVHAADLAARLDVPLVHASSLFVGHGAGAVDERLVPMRPALTRYERSKWHAEQLVADRRDHARPPVTIARVAALIGDAVPTSDRPPRVPFLSFVDQAAQRPVPVIPFARGARLDLVPRDVTAAAVCELLEPPDEPVRVRNLSFGSSAPLVETVLDDLARSVAERTGRAVHPRAVPRDWLLSASRLADRSRRGGRAGPLIGLRYLADDTCYRTSRPLTGAVTLDGLAQALGTAAAPGASSSYYSDWSA